MKIDLSSLNREALKALVRSASDQLRQTKASALFPVGSQVSITADGRQGIVCISGNVNVWVMFADKTSAMFKADELSVGVKREASRIEEAKPSALALADRGSLVYREEVQQSAAPMRKRAPTIHQE